MIMTAHVTQSSSKKVLRRQMLVGLSPGLRSNRAEKKLIMVLNTKAATRTSSTRSTTINPGLQACMFASGYSNVEQHLLLRMQHVM